MKRSVAVVLLAVALAGGGGPASLAGDAVGQETVECSFPVTLADATGAEVTVTDEPDRIVALAPSAAQQLWGIGAEDRVVGMPVNEHTAYLKDRAGTTDVVGDNGQPIQESVVGLEPDLVLAPNVVDNETVATLRGAGLTVYRYHEARSLADVSDEIERTGRLVGSFESAAAVSAEMQGTVEGISDAVAGEPRPSVYYDLGGGWTAGANTFVADLIETAGGENVAIAAGIDGYAEISPEIIADADPAVLVVHEGAPLPDDPAIDNSTAVREGNVVRVDANFINQPGPRNVRPLRRMAEAFHPDALAAVDLDDLDSPAPAQCAMVDGTPDRETDGEAGPGFSALGAVVALAAAARLASLS